MAKKKLKEVAESMFVDNGMTCKAIAEILDVTEKTLSGWRNAGEWDTLRDEALAAPHKIRAILLKELRTISEGGISVIDADALSKIAKVVETMSDKVSPQIVISVLQMLDNWTAEQDPRFAIQALDFHKRFIQHIISLHGDA